MNFHGVVCTVSAAGPCQYYYPTSFIHSDPLCFVVEADAPEASSQGSVFTSDQLYLSNRNKGLPLTGLSRFIGSSGICRWWRWSWNDRLQHLKSFELRSSRGRPVTPVTCGPVSQDSGEQRVWESECGGFWVLHRGWKSLHQGSERGTSDITEKPGINAAVRKLNVMLETSTTWYQLSSTLLSTTSKTEDSPTSSSV